MEENLRATRHRHTPKAGENIKGGRWVSVGEVGKQAKDSRTGTSLVVQWLRICLPVQGTWVQALVWEDPTCHRATKSVHHNY